MKRNPKKYSSLRELPPKSPTPVAENGDQGEGMANQPVEQQAWTLTINLGAPQLLTVIEGLQLLVSDVYAGHKPISYGKMATELLQGLFPAGQEAFQIVRSQMQDEKEKVNPE